MAENESEPKIIVDEDWKSRVQREREELERKQSQPQASEPASAPDPNPAATPHQAAPRRLPPASFATLVSSLTSQAAAALGDAAVPYDPTRNQDQLEPQLALEIARHVIDTLAILEEKTRGNLTPEEHMLLEQGLHELRMAFVEVRKRV